MKKINRVLVTGSDGFIGSHLVPYLERQGVEVIRYDLKRGLNIFDTWSLYHHMRDCDLVIHLAGCTGVPVSYKVPFDYYRVNTEGAARVFRAATEHGIKVLHASTGEVYVQNSPYAASKVGAEAAADAELISNRADIVCLRYLNPYGVGQPLKYVIPIFLLKAIRGEKLLIHGDGEQRKDYIYVTDLVRATWEARKLKSGVKVDVGTGETESINDIAETVQKVIHPKPVTVKRTGTVERPGERKELTGNIEPLLELGWKPRITLEEGVADIYDNLKQRFG